MKKDTIVKFIQKASNFKSVAMASETEMETTFASPGTVFGKIDHILWAIADAKNNKSHLMKFVPIVKQLTKVLNGADALFIRHSEFYHDLKETLNKIDNQISEAKTRSKLSNKLMAKKDQKILEEIEQQVEHLITRIVFAFAQRAKFMKVARQKRMSATLRRNVSSIDEEDENDVNEDLKDPER